ncbi:extracellular solute-binding protein [Altericista sp. CCNU0014]|uniref:extracellular solute-binding protein n=1 Tax=Altericista sp. CCNU0014 TaxID=3082949 RepID=UPI00384CB712
MLSQRFCPFAFSLGLVISGTGCASGPEPSNSPQQTQLQGVEVKFFAGSALGQFCQQAAEQYNAQSPKLPDGKAFYLTCAAQGSGDVVADLVNRSRQLKAGTLKADAPEWPTLIAVDGDIYLDRLAYQIDRIFPGQNYIPDVADAPLLANSPMVLMTQADLAPGLKKASDPFKALATAKNHQALDAAAPAIPIHYVHTAPTRSNSGLQTLIAQFAAISGKRPEQLTLEDVKQHQSKVQQIQSKITRYGVSTDSLAKAMVQNGVFWASVGSVYESSVIAANEGIPPGQPRYEAVYPKATFASNMRAILPKAPWVSADEKAAAEKVVEYLRSPQAQQIATNLGLRPGVPGIALGPKFAKTFGVDPQANYDSYRAPKPEVADAMLESWQVFAKKPSRVVLVVDSSGSMSGTKIAAVQSTLQTYINSLGPKEEVALIDFDSQVRPPVLASGTAAGKAKGFEFIAGLKADGGTRLYDAASNARSWLSANLRNDGINAVTILTDGQDTDSKLTLNQLEEELKKSGFASDRRIAVFTVGYGNAGEFSPDVLKQIASANGGYYSQGDPATIAKLMANLQVEF